LQDGQYDGVYTKDALVRQARLQFDKAYASTQAEIAKEMFKTQLRLKIERAKVDKGFVKVGPDGKMYWLDSVTNPTEAWVFDPEATIKGGGLGGKDKKGGIIRIPVGRVPTR